MRAGRPRSQGPITPPFEGESQKPSPKAKADAVGRPARGSSGAAKRRPHLAVGVSPWKRATPSPEPRRRRQHVALLRKAGEARRAQNPDAAFGFGFEHESMPDLHG